MGFFDKIKRAVMGEKKEEPKKEQVEDKELQDAKSSEEVADNLTGQEEIKPKQEDRTEKVENFVEDVIDPFATEEESLEDEDGNSQEDLKLSDTEPEDIKEVIEVDKDVTKDTPIMPKIDVIPTDEQVSVTPKEAKEETEIKAEANDASVAQDVINAINTEEVDPLDDLNESKESMQDKKVATKVEVVAEKKLVTEAKTVEVSTEKSVTELIDEEAKEIEETPEVDDEAIEEVKEAVQDSPEETIEKYDKGLEKSRKTFGQFMNNLFSNFRMVDDEFFEELEESLISADVGFDIAMRISDELQEEVKLKNVKKQRDVQETIVEKLVEIYESEGVNEVNHLNIQLDGPTIMLFVGVNGVGKTTSIGKLALRYKQQGKKVLLAAADTFRAGAIDQLVVWGERAGVDVVHHKAGSDPAAVVFDAVDKTKKENYDVLLVDTAGRLQNKVNLMKELEKMKRVIEREYPSAPHEVLLVVDATTGQNALVQAKEFKNTTDVTGIVLTKLDGTAKGGIVLAIRNELHLPVKLVGLGEKITDLADFDPNQFVYGLFKELMENYE